MNVRYLPSIPFLILVFVFLAPAQSSSDFQKGTFTAVTPQGPKLYELRNGNIGYQINNCGDFQVGQAVDYLVKEDKIQIRLNGTVYKCAIKSKYSPNPNPVAGPRTYMKGTIQGYEIRYRPSKATSGIRRAKIYDLLGPDLIYEIDFCGSFQAGEFTAGQTVEFRVEPKEERLYVLHDGNKEYSCQLEATLKPGESKPQEDESPKPVASTAKLSITSMPDGADIEIDGSFSGNAPSDLAVPEGEHAITIKKSGYKPWERTLKVVAGSNIHVNAELEKTPNP